MSLKSLIRTIHDYPKPGVQFRDITSLLENAKGLRMAVEGATLTLAVPLWRRGEDLCCPSRLRERDYAWSTGARRFVRRAVRTVVR